jgi:thiol-disulfide isomerase/thioredoxin
MLKHTLILLGITAQAIAATSSLKEVQSPQEFQEAVNSKKECVIIFYAPWCGACNSMKDTISDVAKSFKDDLTFIKVDASNEKLKDIVDTFGVQAIPTIFIKQVGAQDKGSFTRKIEQFTGKKASSSTDGMAKKVAQVTPKKGTPKLAKHKMAMGKKKGVAAHGNRSKKSAKKNTNKA